MFQTIIKLYDNQVQTKKIYFDGSIIVCDEKNVCFLYYDALNNKVVHETVSPANIATIVSLI